MISDMRALVNEKEIVSAADAMIAQLYDDIRDYVQSQDNGSELQRLEYAFEDIQSYHGNQLRKSGEPVIIHPLRVAWSICEASLDSPTVIVALLHDTIEDTELTKSVISTRYGEWYADMVDGLTKIVSPETTHGKQKANQEATYRKILVTMVKDVRILFIKLFDRLDNMRDMEPMPRHKQRRISQETLDIYVPLSKRLGLEKISMELSDLCFRYLYPKRYNRTTQKLKTLKKERQFAIQSMSELLHNTLSRSKLPYNDVDPIFTHPESYVLKKEVDHVLEGFRILVEYPLDTYYVLGVLHTNFSAIPLKIKDFISNPRWDGYQGLQTEIIVQGEVTFIEIATRQMHSLNWHGIMAHWKGTSTELAEYYRVYFEQIDNIIGEKEPRMDEVLRYSTTDQFQVFTPKGDIYFFPQGASILDFAYHIHSDLGNTCAGALVSTSSDNSTNTIQSKRVPRECLLADGERIQILTDSSVKPNRDWLTYVATAKSKVAIQRAISVQNKLRTRQVGKDFFQKEMIKLGENVETLVPSDEFQDALKHEKISLQQFQERLGSKQIHVRRFLKKHQLVSKAKLDRRDWQVRFLDPLFKSTPPEFIIEDIKDPFLRFAECCAPLPGDKVVGFPTDMEDLVIHRHNCSHIKEEEKQPISVGWNVIDHEDQTGHHIRLITLEDKGVIFQITKVIKSMGGNIMDIESGRMEKDAYVFIRLEPLPLKNFHKILSQLRALKCVIKIL
ncbi:MAG: bifunctional (p)ppGpp synthetase/guanosine-3',5'-bis(diphosphate) 3'-pyrophosphohydrolase [SAR324 cluster bacterium]|nr:bifunctional (p)ppGpp synthetase/guanosine-3',5'-bis(diphosphate) 3'-pyrophosphohydrolase [SAR324 cluster bacterium]